MPRLTLTGTWDAQEEALDLARRPGVSEVLVVRPSLPPVLLDAGGQVRWQGSTGALVAAWTPQGDRLALGREDGSVQILAPESSDAPVTIQTPARWVTALAWSPNGQQLAVAAGKTLTWWDPLGHEAGRWDQAPSTVADLHWPAVGPLAACGYGGAWVFGQPGAPPTRSLSWKGSSLKVRWSPNLKWLATADQDKTVHVWPWPLGSDLMMGSFDAKALSLLWTPSGSHLATSGSSTLLLWDCRGKGPGGRRPEMGPQQEGLITAIDLAEHYATVDDEGALTVWDPDLKVLAQIDLGQRAVAVRWTSQRSLMAAQANGTVTRASFA